MTRKIKHGFTFIELLISFTIFSIIATSIYYTLNTGIKVWRSENAVINENQKLRICFDKISGDLKNAVVFSMFKPEWDSESMSFPTLLNVYKDGSAERELAKVIYFFNGSDEVLTRAVATLDIGFDGDSAEKEVILDEVENISFEYPFGGEDPEEKLEWKEKWEIKDKIPRGVKITLKRKNGETFEKMVFIPMGEIGKEE